MKIFACDINFLYNMLNRLYIIDLLDKKKTIDVTRPFLLNFSTSLKNKYAYFRICANKIISTRFRISSDTPSAFATKHPHFFLSKIKLSLYKIILEKCQTDQKTH